MRKPCLLPIFKQRKRAAISSIFVFIGVEVFLVYTQKRYLGCGYGRAGPLWVNYMPSRDQENPSNVRITLQWYKNQKPCANFGNSRLIGGENDEHNRFSNCLGINGYGCGGDTRNPHDDA